MTGFFLATPTLNFDDLTYAESVPILTSQIGLLHSVSYVLLNNDFGVTQIRTYGLARAIEVLTMTLFGKAALPTYAFMAALHAASAAVVFQLMRILCLDKVTAAFCAIAWFAAPSILPMLKVEHHFLYLVASFYPLLLWLLLVLKHRRLSHITSVALLAATWWMGEAPIIPMAAAVAWISYKQRDLRILLQGIAAFVLLGLYVGYQVAFVNDPTQAQRLAPHGMPFTAVVPQLWEYAKAVLGFRYHDGELVSDVGGIKIYKTAITWVVGLIALAASLPFIQIRVPQQDFASNQSQRKTGAAAFVCVAVLSIAVFVLFAFFHIGPIALRYAAAFYGLLPLAVIVLVANRGTTSAARITACAFAIFSVATSIGLLYRAEMLVNRPNRAFLAQIQPEKAVIFHHVGWSTAADGTVGLNYPGLVSSLKYALQNPLRSAVLTEQALRLYAGVSVGTACRMSAHDTVDVYFQGALVKSAPSNDVKAFGLPSPDASDSKELSVADLCGPAPPGIRGPAMKPFLLILKFAVSAVLIYLLVHRVNFAPAAAFLQSDRADIALALCIAVLMVQAYMAAVRLRWIMRAIGADLPVSLGFSTWMIGLFVSQALVTFVAGDAARIWQISQRGYSKRLAGSAIILERGLGLAILMALLLACLPFLLSHAATDSTHVGLLVLAALCVVGIMGFSASAFLERLVRHLAPQLHNRRMLASILDVISAARHLATSPVLTGGIMMLSVAMHLCNVLCFYLFGVAAHLDVDLGATAIIALPVMLIALMPIALAGWGVREGAAVVGYGLFGVGPETAVALSVAFGLALLIASLPGGFYLWREKAALRPAAESEEISI